jgi:hypothetical protein
LIAKKERIDAGGRIHHLDTGLRKWFCMMILLINLAGVVAQNKSQRLNSSSIYAGYIQRVIYLKDRKYRGLLWTVSSRYQAWQGCQDSKIGIAIW